jgi:hypothetical protein
MERMPGQIDGSQFVIRDLDASRVGMAILDGSDRESFFGPGMRDQFKHDFKRGEGVARQLMERKAKNRCSILFHLLVADG